MRLLYRNLVDAATVEGSSEVVGHEANKVQNPHLAQAWITTGDSNENLVIDLDSAKDVTCFVVLAHNLTSGATIHIQANSTNVWTSPAVSVQPTHYEGFLVYFWTSKQTYQYWRIRIQDASNPNGYITIGRIAFGEYKEINPPKYSWQITPIDTTKKHKSITGQIYANLGVITNEYGFDLPLLRQADKDILDDLIGEVKTGIHFVAILNDTILEEMPVIYGVLQNPPRYTHKGTLKYGTQFKILEGK